MLKQATKNKTAQKRGFIDIQHFETWKQKLD